MRQIQRQKYYNNDPTKDIYVNDSYFVIPYKSENDRIQKIKNLEEQKKRGGGIKYIGYDERSESVIYSQIRKKESSFH
jgi:hypothetical protein